jgi:hypothetical protein
VASSATTRVIAVALLAAGAVTGAIAGVLARDHDKAGVSH